MYQVRFHGRGGQGVVTAAELLSVAAFAEGRHAQAVPTFGSERTGAPVVAFCRVDDRPIRTREPVATPDALVVLDTTLVAQIDVFAGLKPEGCVLLNTGRSLEEVGVTEQATGVRSERVFAVPATEIAIARIGKPFPNAAMLGGLAAFTKIVSLESVAAAIRERFEPEVAERNIVAAREAYEFVDREFGREVLRATPD
ncbi:MAG TPA: 2-oxoacid:acceptor oxidoreductase family protein [Acidimicrobiales bacterium]|nr:2-oxoacid:acceptor oxidoreductase family protein [Acidimicrobiales bacterium]